MSVPLLAYQPSHHIKAISASERAPLGGWTPRAEPWAHAGLAERHPGARTAAADAR